MVEVLWTPHWYRLLFDSIKAAHRHVFLVSPWLKMAGAELILNALLENTSGDPQIGLLTTLEEKDLVESNRISDLEAYMLLLSYGVSVRVIRGLHAKIYLFDDSQAIVTSGNLTSRGLGRANACNLEVAIHIEAPEVVSSLKAQLVPVWNESEPLTSKWLKKIANRLADLDSAEKHIGDEYRSPTVISETSPKGFGAPWWKRASISDQDRSFSVALQASDLLSSLEIDPDLGDAFAIIRQVHGRIGRHDRAKADLTHSASGEPLAGRNAADTDSENTEPLAHIIERTSPATVGKQIDGPELDADEVLLKELYQTIQHEQTASQHVPKSQSKIEGHSPDAEYNQRSMPSVGQTLRGRIVRFLEYGLLVRLGYGTYGLIHRSELSWLNRGRTRWSDTFKIGDECDVVVLDARRSKNSKRLFVSLSHRLTQKNPWDNLASIHPVGSRAKGRVIEFLQFGALLELESSFTCLVHNKEISWTEKNVNAQDILHIDDIIEVVVQHVDPAKRKIHASYRQAIENPWTTFIEKYPIGTMTKGVVIGLRDFGAFVKLPDGCVGLLHRSQIPPGRALLEVGDTVSLEVLDYNIDRQKISLGISKG